MKIKGVVFDCFGVMMMPGRTILYQEHPELAMEIHDIEKRRDVGGVNRQEFVSSIAKMTGIDEQKIAEEYYSLSGYHVAMLEWAWELKQSGEYRLALLSNIGVGWLEDFFESPLVKGLFDQVVLSYKEQLVKPDPAIYRLTADRLGLSPEECVMIDDLPANIDGAEAAGMKGIVFSTTIQTKDDFYKLIGE